MEKLTLPKTYDLLARIMEASDFFSLPQTFFSSPLFFGLSIFGLILGLGLGYLLNRWIQNLILRRAQTEAQDLLREVQDRLELIELDRQERIQEIESECWSREEVLLLRMEERVEELEELLSEKKQKNDTHYSQVRQPVAQMEIHLKDHSQELSKLQEKIDQRHLANEGLRKSYLQKLGARTGVEGAESKIFENLKEETLRRWKNHQSESSQSLKDHAETLSKVLLDRVLCRIQIPYCPERGIAPVYFQNEEQRRWLLGQGKDEGDSRLKVIMDATGCDIIVEEGQELIGVAGFDPVRRELTRRVLERLLKEKKEYSLDFIKRTVSNTKRDLLSQIQRDGDQLTKQMGLTPMHPEIRRMMGSLRYRYSFTQNQYFHCSEVGWLAGLLAAELNSLELQGMMGIKKARRSGMLHDLGKAMDHELEGGHALIGANFIEARGEALDVVHAVRAHHFDEQPSTDLAFLVIAADAISGSRPGARRSTLESYNQKVTELENIATSFKGVTDCYILNGGRECRVLVNGRQVSDRESVALSQKIATRIENECNYPGQIKVVVVRETLVCENTRAH